MFDWSQIINSIIGSLIAGLVFVATAPVWWERFRKMNLSGDIWYRLKETSLILIPIIVLALLFFVAISYIPHMTDEEIVEHTIICELRASEAADRIQETVHGDRQKAYSKFFRLCLKDKGIEEILDDEAKH